MPEYTYRLASEQDMEGVAALFAGAFPESIGSSSEGLIHWLDRPFGAKMNRHSH